MEPSSLIEKLSANNYSTWVEDIKVLLMEKNCWRIVTGTETKPTEPVKEEDEDEAEYKYKLRSYHKDVKDFNTRADRAYSIIYLNLEKPYRGLITSTDDPTVAWTKLKEQCQPSSRARIVNLMDQFFNCRIEPNEELGLYASRLQNIVSQLKDAGHSMSDWLEAFQLIRFLPEEYRSIVQSIYRWSDDQFKFDKILQELIAEEARLKLCTIDTESLALHSSAESSSAKSKPTTNVSTKSGAYAKKITCFKCGKKGHVSSKCRATQNSSFLTETLNIESSSDSKTWILDSAATSHFCCNRDLITDYKPLHNEQVTVAINGCKCPIEGTGTVTFDVVTLGELQTVNLKNVLYSPKLRRNLISCPKIDDNGGSLYCKDNKFIVYNKNKEKVMIANKYNGLYYIKPKSYKNVNIARNVKSNDDKIKETSKLKSKVNFKNKLFKKRVKKVKPKVFNTVKYSKGNLKEWHAKFCHVNHKYILSTVKNKAVFGMPDLKSEELNCEPCKLAKQRRTSFKSIGKIRSKKPLELLHMDVCGPMPNVAIGGYKYFLTITDDFSRKVNTYPLKEKSEVFKCFTNYQMRNERFLNTKVISVRTDQGMEFCSNEFETFLDNQGIKVERTNAYSPEMNGVSERFNYTAVDAIKVLLNSSNLKNHFWSEALLCHTYVWNRICHGEQTLTPFELFCGRKPSVKHLQIFGTTAFVGIPKQKRRKLDMRAKKGTFVGYALKTKGYRIYLPDERKIIETINVKFQNETEDKVVSEANQTFNFQFSDEISGSDTDSEDERVKVKTKDKVIPKPIASTSKSSTLNEIKWYRKAVTRPDGSRTDIYYYPNNTKTRLRSLNDVKKYCESNQIVFDKNIFNFDGKDKYTGIVNEVNQEINEIDIA